MDRPLIISHLALPFFYSFFIQTCLRPGPADPLECLRDRWIQDKTSGRMVCRSVLARSQALPLRGASFEMRKVHSWERHFPMLRRPEFPISSSSEALCSSFHNGPSPHICNLWVPANDWSRAV